MTLDCDLLPWLSNMNRKWCDKAASLISRSKVVLFKKIIVQKHIPDRLLYLLITFGFHRNYMKRISAAVHLPNKSRHLAFRRDLNVNSISANTNHHYIISSQSSYSIQMKCQTLPLKIPPPLTNSHWMLPSLYSWPFASPLTPGVCANTTPF